MNPNPLSVRVLICPVMKLIYDYYYVLKLDCVSVPLHMGTIVAYKHNQCNSELLFAIMNYQNQMGPASHLIIHNIVSIVSAISMIGTAFFTYLNGPRRMANITLSMAALASAIFIISHIVGVNVADPYSSRSILMLNLSTFFISAFNLHAVLCLIGKNKEKFRMIAFVYFSATVLSLLFFLVPHLFLIPSVPKMYFVNYYEPGILHWVRIVFMFVIITPYMVYLLYSAYRKTTSYLERNQYKYFIASIIVAYGIGFIPNLLIYDIPVDPLWGMSFAVVFAIPFIYGAIRYELFNIQVIAKQAFLYSLAVALVGGIITLLNYSNRWIEVAFPSFPIWITTIISAIVAVTISVLIWHKLRQGDLLKYEFITTVTHKFRTPLTHIKWAAENISKAKSTEDISLQISYIQNANEKLVELTDLLANASEKKNSDYEYHFERGDISVLAEDVIKEIDQQLSAKNITLTKNLEPKVMANFDPARLKFVLQTFLENALHYSPEGGTISVSVGYIDSNAVFSVSDSGIGMTKEELEMLFAKFYRGERAKLEDTEGMGLGLFISREIITHHGGQISASSDGIGKGSKFSFSLPTIM